MVNNCIHDHCSAECSENVHLDGYGGFRWRPCGRRRNGSGTDPKAQSAKRRVRGVDFLRAT